MNNGIAAYLREPENKKIRALLADIDARLIVQCRDNKLARDNPMRPFIYQSLDLTEFKETQEIVHQKTTE